MPGIRAGQVYGFRAHGPWAPERGLRFDGDRILLDPYGRGVAVPAGYRRTAGSPGEHGPGDEDAAAMKSVVVDLAAYDWEGDRPLDRPFADTVIYEAHVRGFTAHPNCGVDPARRGTYAGFIEKIPYLVDLGITAVELLPVFQFDAQDAPAAARTTGATSPSRSSRPHAAYSSRPGAQGAVDEFRDLVKALHRAGLEVILDVVYNHTAEGGDDGPTFAYRGLANDEYYILDPRDRSRYADYSGCGNTLNANEPVVRRLILDSLRYWVAEMHVDGFRFDLASVLSRDEDGDPVPRPPIIWDIETDPVLAGTKLIAEAWDAAGLYQVGSFAGDRWTEWNGRFRDDVRSFVKSDPGKAWAVGQRLLGSPDIYAHLGREPAEDDQLRDLPRRLHAQRRRLVRPQAQRGERRGQPRRQRPRTCQLERRRRGADRRPGDRGAPRAPGQEPARARAAGGRRADADDGRRGAPDAAGQQQRATARTASCRGSTGALVERNAGLLRFTQGLIAGRRAARGAVRRAVGRDARRAARARRGSTGTARGSGEPDTSDDVAIASRSRSGASTSSCTSSSTPTGRRSTSRCRRARPAWTPGGGSSTRPWPARTTSSAAADAPARRRRHATGRTAVGGRAGGPADAGRTAAAAR